MIGVTVGWLGTTGRIISAAVMVALEDQSQGLLRTFRQWRCKYLGIGARAGHIVTFAAVTGTHCDISIDQGESGLS